MRRIALLDAARVWKELVLDGSQQHNAQLHSGATEISQRDRV